MKKRFIIFLCVLALQHQMVLCMDQQSIATEPSFSITIEPCSAPELTQRQPDFKNRLLNKVAGMKNWITKHKKEILVGGMALAVVTAAALYYYTPQSAPLHAQSIDALNTVTPTPPSVQLFFNTTAYQCANPQKLLAAADACARIPSHCWVEPSQRASTEFFPYALDGKEHDYSISGCSRQDLQRLYSGYQACYNTVIKYAREHELPDLQSKIITALKKAKIYWEELKWYGVVKEKTILTA